MNVSGDPSLWYTHQVQNLSTRFLSRASATANFHWDVETWLESFLNS